MTPSLGRAPIRGLRPSGTFLLESVADGFGRAAVALLLPGAAENTVMGLCAVRLAGGRVLALKDGRRERLNKTSEMAIGLADAVLPADQLAAQLIEAVDMRAVGGPVVTDSTTMRIAS